MKGVFYLVFSACIAIYAFRKKSIAKSGVWALAFICLAFVLMSAFSGLNVLFLMFASSSLLSKFKKANSGIEVKEGPRDYIQAIANLGVPILSYLFYYFFGQTCFLAAFIAGVAAANADTWSSEIGSWSKSPPRSILTGKEMQTGESGGVSFLGTVGGVFGAMLIVVYAFLAFENLAIQTSYWLILFLMGCFGFVLDSILGAALQSIYVDPISGDKSEIEKVGYELSKGWSWLNNDLVNLLTTSFVVLLTVIIT